MRTSAPKSTTSGSKSAAPFGKDAMPTNAAKLGTLGTMLKAIRHIGRPEKSATKPPFAK